MTVNFSPIDGKFAFEVIGLELWRDLDDATVAELAQAWSSQGVLVFRRQALSEQELVAFSRRFGDLDVIVRTDWQAEQPEVTQISNMKDYFGKSIGGLGARELFGAGETSVRGRQACQLCLALSALAPAHAVEEKVDDGRRERATLAQLGDRIDHALV